MNKKEKIFVVNNQEDEDGYSLNPENTFIPVNVKIAPAKQSRNNPANDRSRIIKTKPGGLFVSGSLPGRK